jgi:lipopolysaccharide transport system permease protein
MPAPAPIDAAPAADPAPRAAAESFRGSSHLGDFIWTLIRTDFKARYHGAMSGFAWAMLKPLAMFSVLFSVFSFLFRDKLYLFRLMLGLLLWDFFAESTRVGLESLRAKRFLITKAVFPRAVVVVTSMSNALITLLVFATAFILVSSMTGHAPSLIGVVLFFFYVLQLIAIVIGFSLAASVLFVRYRDLNQVWDVALQAGFFFAPIIYPLNILPERLHIYLYLWPATPVIQFAREVLIDGSIPTFKAHLLLFGAAVLALSIGAFTFRRMIGRAVEKL